MPGEHRDRKGRGRPRIESMSSDEIGRRLTEDEREVIALTKIGRYDPVFFLEKMVGLALHNGQKVWLWCTTKTQKDKAYELGHMMGLKNFENRGIFDERWALSTFKKNILVPANRWGKTFCTSGKHLWYCYYKIGVRGTAGNIAATRCGTLNLSPHSNQANAGYQYILDFLASKTVWVRDGISVKNNCKIGFFLKGSNKQSRTIEFSNGTTYKAFPTGEDQASSLAGTPFLYISYDECAQSLHLKDELPAKIMSRLIDYGGPLDLISTPEVDKPSHQYFFHIAKQGMRGEEGWWTMIGKMSDNDFLGKAEMESTLESIRQTDPQKYRQVAFGEFVTTGKKMFDAVVIERLWDKKHPETPTVGRRYVLSVDWGFADTGDPSVFYVLDYTDYPNIRIAFRDSIKGGNPFAVITYARMLQREWNGAKFIHDSGGLGGVMMRKMLKEVEVQDVIDFSAIGNKLDMLFAMQLCVTAGRAPIIDPEGRVTETNPNFGRLRSYYIYELEEQLGNYQYNPDKGVSDKKLVQDEVMALGQGIWYLEKTYGKLKAKAVVFNPLANDARQIFSEMSAKQLGVKSVELKETRIF